MQVCLSVYQRNIVNLWLIKYAKLKAYTAAYSCVYALGTDWNASKPLG